MQWYTLSTFSTFTGTELPGVTMSSEKWSAGPLPSSHALMAWRKSSGSSGCWRTRDADSEDRRGQRGPGRGRWGAF